MFVYWLYSSYSFCNIALFLYAEFLVVFCCCADYLNDSSGSVFMDDYTEHNGHPGLNFQNPEYFDDPNFNVLQKPIPNKGYYNDLSGVNGENDEHEPLVLSEEMKPETTV